MKITIVNGSAQVLNTDFDIKISSLKTVLKSEFSDFEIDTIDLKQFKIKSCNGCWGCWLKTPGECVIKDDMALILPKIINSDLLLFASPLILGFPSAGLKIFMDRLIPLLLPYIELVNNECHHLKRYDHYPKIGLLYQTEPDTDVEDIAILKDIFTRFAINFKSSVALFQSIDKPLNFN